MIGLSTSDGINKKIYLFIQSYFTRGGYMMKIYMLIFCLFINFAVADDNLCFSIKANLTRYQGEYYLQLDNNTYWLLQPLMEEKEVIGFFGSSTEATYYHPVPKWMLGDQVQILRAPSVYEDYPVQILHPFFNETVNAKQIDPNLEILNRLDRICHRILFL